MATRTQPKTPNGNAVALWERVPPVSRDRSTVLTVEEITASAFDIAEADGLLAVSVKRVANKLGVPAPRLEQFLTSREDLYDLMLDQGISEIELGQDLSTSDWRPQLQEIAEATYAVCKQHSWLVELINARSPSGPNGLRYMERALAALSETGLDVSSAALCFNAVLAFVCGSVRIESRKSAASWNKDNADSNARYLMDATAVGEYPYLAKLFANASDVTSDESFFQGLDCLLDGISERIRRPDADDGDEQ